MKKGARLLFRQCRRRRQQQQQPVSPVGATRRTCSGCLAFSHQMVSSPPESSSVRYCYEPTLRWNPQVEEYFAKAYGSDHFARISTALTHPSSYSCIRVNTPKTSVDSVIEKLTSVLLERILRNPQSSINSMCIDKSNGSAEGDHDLKLSAHKDGLLGDSTGLLVQKCQIPGLEYVLFVKGSGPHLLRFGDASGLKEVIVSRKCAEAVLRGAHVFVPGVLACSSHVEKGDLVAVSVAVEQPGPDGEWGVHITRGTVLQGLPSDPHYHERNGLYIGQGMAMMSRAGIFRALQGVAVDMTSRIYNLPSFHDVLEGEIFLQNLPSIIAAHVLDPQEGERILDMCAAPGGKTTAIAALMRDKGEVIALDRSHNKETIESLKNHANYQRRMFDQAVQLVRPGGIIVYSTCTINPGENEALVRYALDKYKFLSLAPQNPRIGGPGLVGGCELLDGKYIEKWLTETEAELVQRFDPSSSLDTIGFFIAKFNVGTKDV